MTNSDPELRDHFDFGARPSRNTGTQIDPSGSSNQTLRFPGTYVPEDPIFTENEQDPLDHVDPKTEPEDVNTTPQNPDKTCRICLAGAEDGRLISPCRCRGTMKFVHVSCLNSWRYASPNRKSVYQCDQCGYKYSFNRTQYAAIVGSLYSRIVTTIILFLLAVFLSGFIFKFILYITGASFPFASISALLDLLFGIDPIDEMSGFDLDAWGYQTPKTLNEVFFSGWWDAAHWALGVIGLALWGFVSVMSGLGVFGVHLRFGNWRRRAGDGERRRPGTMGGIMWGIVILIGTAKMLKAIYGRVNTWIMGYQARLETAILEVDPDGE